MQELLYSGVCCHAKKFVHQHAETESATTVNR